MSAWLPGCHRQDFGTSGGSWARQPAMIVLHSTEGTSWPGYDSGQSAPHFTIDPETGERRQHIAMTEAARALANSSGGVETNRAGCIQIEIIGTCDPSHEGEAGWTFLPDADLSHVAALVADIARDQEIPLTSSVEFIGYPASYGTGNGVRLSSSAWGSYRGVCGHQHVPENDHGDPGDIDIAAILGGDMPLTDDDVRAIWAMPTTLNDGTQTSMGELLRWAYYEARDTWAARTTSPVDGSEVDTLTVLRWAYGDAHKAAGQEGDR